MLDRRWRGLRAKGPIAALVPLFDDACDADSLINVLVGHPEVVALGPMYRAYWKGTLRDLKRYVEEER